MKWDWRPIWLSGTAAGMELCWLWAVLDLFGRKGAGTMPAWMFAALYLLPFGIRRSLAAFRWRNRNLFGSAAGAAVVITFTKAQFFDGLSWWNPDWLFSLFRAMAGVVHAFNPESVFILSGALLWGCGWRLASLRPEFTALISEFQFGLAILVAAHFVYAQLEWRPAGLMPVSLGFFLFGLSGIPVAHAVEGKTWLSGNRKGRWFGVLFLSIGLILGAGLLIGFAVGPELVEFLFSLVAAAGRLVFRALEIFFSLLNQFFSPPKTGGLPPPLQLPSKGPAEAPFVLFSETTREIMRFFWTLLVLSLVLVALWRISSQIFEWLRRRLGEMEEATVEPLEGAFREDLLNFLRRVVLAIFRLRLPWRRRLPALTSRAESVRRVYRQLLAWAAARGHARLPWQTPHEYLETLLRWLPQNEGEIKFITDEYVRARYSPSLPSVKEVLDVRQRWWKLRKKSRAKSAAATR